MIQRATFLDLQPFANSYLGETIRLNLITNVICPVILEEVTAESRQYIS